MFQGANTLEEAVGQFYENPEKYTPSLPPTKADPPPSKGGSVSQPRDPKTQDLPPQYAPPTTSPPRQRRQPLKPHTNAVIQAGHVRARDEVRFTLPFKP